MRAFHDQRRGSPRAHPGRSSPDAGGDRRAGRRLGPCHRRAGDRAPDPAAGRCLGDGRLRPARRRRHARRHAARDRQRPGRPSVRAARVGPGQAVRLFTGSVVPQGADAILLQEDATATGTEVRVNEAVIAGRHIRRAGQDFAAGDAVVPAGRRLTARDIGLAAAANHPWLTVHRRPRVAILATGDEIAMPGEPIPPGGIVSSNSHALAALVRAAGGEPVVLPVAADTREAVAAVADAVHGMDMLVTTGGASVGDHDLVIESLQSRGLELDFWQIAMRPGKPLLFGRLGPVPVLGLPGNPVSAHGLLDPVPAAGAEPARAACRPRPPPTVQAIAGAALRANDHRADHLRATVARRSARPDRGHAVPGAGFGDAAPPGPRRRADPARAERAGAAGGQRGHGDSPRFARPLTRFFRTIGSGNLDDAARTYLEHRSVADLFHHEHPAPRGKTARHADEKAVRTAPVHRPASQADRLLAELRGDEGRAQAEVEVRHPPVDLGARGARLPRPPPAPRPGAGGAAAAGEPRRRADSDAACRRGDRPPPSRPT